MIAGGAPALQVSRAVTRLTVHRSLPYQNSSEAGQKGRLHADTLDHEKVVSEDFCCDEGAWEFKDCCGAHIAVYRNGIEV